MRDNNVLDQFGEAVRPTNTKKLQNLYRLFFCNFAGFYSFLLLIMYGHGLVHIQAALGIQNRTNFKFFVYILLAVAVLSFIAGGFFRLRYDYFLPLGNREENSRAAARYFSTAVGLAVFSWLVFYSVSAESVGEAIGFKKETANNNFGYFLLFMCFAVAFLYTLLAGLWLVQSAKFLQKKL